MNELKALISNLENALEELDSLKGIDWTDKEKATIEGRARELAKEKILASLLPFLEQKSTNQKQKHQEQKTGIYH